MWCLHSAEWWRRHWERTGILEGVKAESLRDGWQLWKRWQQAVSPDNVVEIEALEADRGEYLGYVRAVGRRSDVDLEEPIISIPTSYTRQPLLRSQGNGVTGDEA
jgi:hypothetical protein